MSTLEGMVRNTKFVFHTAQIQSKEGIVLDHQQFSVLKKNSQVRILFSLKYLKELYYSRVVT